MKPPERTQGDHVALALLVAAILLPILLAHALYRAIRGD